MKEQQRRGRTVFLLIAVAVFVVAVVFLLAEFSNGSQKKQGIVLPPASSEPVERPTDEGTNPDFVMITPENLALLIHSFETPACYVQTMHRTIHGYGATDEAEVKIHNFGSVCKMEVLQSGVTRHFLSDGETLYLWNGDDADTVEETRLSAGVTLNDVVGILSYEDVAELPVENILRTVYIPVSQEVDVNYLYLSTKQGENLVADYWVDMSTGILNMTEIRDGNTVLYSLYQTSFEVFESSQEDFLGHFSLPDGTAPFAIEAE